MIIWHGNEAYVGDEFVGRVMRAPKTKRSVEWIAWVMDAGVQQLGEYQSLGDARSAVEARIEAGENALRPPVSGEWRPIAGRVRQWGS